MSIFFLLKLRTTTLATSLSRPGRIFGSPSRIVTWAPRSANVEANSQPMAPPPMTAMRAGTWSRSSTSSLVMIGPPRSKLGISRGTEPAARRTLVPVISVVDPSAAVTVTTWSGPRRAGAVEHLDLAALAHRRDAADEPGDDLLLALLGDGEVDGRLRWTRCRTRRRAATWRCTAAVSRNALAGMQPRLRQVPPSASFSTMRDLHAGRGGVERGGVPTGASADDDEIELLGRRDHLSRSWSALVRRGAGSP